MAIVITNGAYYIYLNQNGKHRKTNDICQALQFNSINEAIKYMNKAPAKTDGYYVYDTHTKHVLWKRLTEEEQTAMQELKERKANINRRNDGKIKRRTYSPDVKKLIYIKSDGRCALCGRKILLEDATLDHIVPLAKGGIDSVENLQLCCHADNIFKGAIKPEDFMERITEIFMYQMEKKSNNGLRWKLASRLFSPLLHKN
ncbi:HNH endonuclease [Roseburia hominis]|uniref:HNH endonuclease signature motif containing protein n=1 Tax=Roseburia hominis TaxID=301301 RepID=UPI001F3A0265|nr:HNH endonuclease [Roseburia hominis]